MIRIRTLDPKDTVAGERYLMVATAMGPGLGIRTRPALLEVYELPNGSGENGEWVACQFYEESK